MKKIIFISLWLILSVIGFSQKSESIVWGDSLFAFPTDAIFNQNSTIIVSGDYGYFDSNGNRIYRGLIVVFGDFSNINHYFHPLLQRDTGTTYLEITQLLGGEYLCVGREKKINIDTIAPIFFTVLDSNLSFVSEKSYFLPPQYPTGRRFHSVFESTDTLLYAFSARVPYVYPTLGYDLGLMRVSANGDTIESRYHEFSSININNSCEVYDIVKLPGENKYVVPAKVGTGAYRAIVVNHDLSIDTIYSYDGPDELYGIYGTRDFGYWKADGTFLTAGDGFIESKGDMALFAANCDLEGNMLDYVLLNTSVQDQSAFNQCMAGANDSTIYVLGHDMCLGCDPVNDIGFIEAFAVDADLNVLGYNVIADDGYYKSWIVSTNEAGDLIVIGTKNVGNTYHFNIYVARIPRKELELTTSIARVNNNELFSNAFPNPAHGTINFKVDNNVLRKGVRIVFHTLSGKTALNKPVIGDGNIIKVNISNLPDGAYVYEIVIDSKTLSKGKFIKQ